MKRISCSNQRVLFQKELGIEPDPTDSPINSGISVGISYMIAAAIPLFPYFFLTGGIAIATSIAATFLALFLIGAVKGKFASMSVLKSGLQVLLIGTGSGIGGYFLGTILPHILGIK
jgi:VIT1/CCC1 family predicted Fe2+/Mn2+ transporter